MAKSSNSIHFWPKISTILSQKTEKSNFDDELTSIKDRHPDGMKTEAKLLIIHMVVSR